MRRALIGQLDYIAHEITRLSTLIGEAERTADINPETRWFVVEAQTQKRELDALRSSVKHSREQLIIRGSAREKLADFEEP